ncbi:MAG: long-chain-fatty-acid--CoA ligase [Euryarchaeota archaeon]|nr:long-chain-fatty-acid--CoA ligase [Euryarchaeota archaeon]
MVTVNKTLGKILDEAAEKFPDKDVILFENRKLTYGELNERTNEFALGLLKLGLKKGDKVGLWMSNYPEWVIAYFGIAKAGGVVVPMNTRYKTHELEYILDNSEATTLIMVDKFVGIDFVEMANKVKGNLPNLKNIIVMGEPDEDMYEFYEVCDEGKKWEESEELQKRRENLDPEDCVFILYTSGTTGAPKGAMLSHNNIGTNARDVTGVLKTTEDDRFLLAVPFFHCFGCVMGVLGSIYYGASMVPMVVFKAEETMELIEKHNVSILYGVPTMFVLELEAFRKRGYNIDSLRTGIMAGAPCPEEIMKGVMNEMHCNVSIAYGLTEASPVITMTRFDDSIEKRVETVGKPLPGIEVKIVDDQHKRVPAGTRGELICKGYNVMMGYYKMPGKTEETIEDGWLYSGDLAVEDEEGYYKITGRKKDMLLVGGFNVYPREIEEFLFTNPKVQNASVIGLPDNVFGEVVMAYLIPEKGAELRPEEIVKFCKGEIANFKVPWYVKVVDEMPMTASGKIQKFKLREEAEKLLDKGELKKLK